MRARLEQADRLSRGLDARLVEHVVAEPAIQDRDAALLERLDLVAQVRQHEGDQRRLRQLAAVQADREPAVADGSVRVREGLAGRDLREAEPFVERERCDRVGRVHADLVKAPDHRGGCRGRAEPRDDEAARGSPPAPRRR